MRQLMSFLMGGLLFLVAGTAAGQNNTNPQGDALMRALLDEMRLLRTAMERNAAADLRSRLLLERMRHQQDIVRELQREADNRRMEEESRMHTEPFEWEAATMETRMREATDPATKRQIEQEMAGMKKRQEMMERHRQRMEVRAQQQEQRLVEETARLRGIEDELQRLAATLTTP